MDVLVAFLVVEDEPLVLPVPEEPEVELLPDVEAVVEETVVVALASLEVEVMVLWVVVEVEFEAFESWLVCVLGLLQ